MVRVRVPLSALVATLFVVAGCAQPPADIIGVDGREISALSISGNTFVDVYIATSRQRADDVETLFTLDRGQETGFAKVTVSIPAGHVPGSIERPRGPVPDPRTEFAIVAPRVFDGGQGFTASLNNELRERPSREQRVLIFVHGYNTDLTSAILRTAQFAHDTGFEGIPVVFSWASRGRTFDYVYDFNSALHARDRFLEAVEAVAQSRARGAAVVAHSMGNVLVIEALRQAAIEGGGRLREEARVEQIILAAPDIDVDLFEEQVRNIPLDRVPIFVLASSQDKALAISRRIAGGVERVGAADAERLADLGVVVIDLSQIEDTDALSHTTFANSPEVVQLVGQGLRQGNSLDARRRPSAAARAVAGVVAIPVEIVGGDAAVVIE